MAVAGATTASGSIVGQLVFVQVQLVPPLADGSFMALGGASGSGGGTPAGPGKVPRSRTAWDRDLFLRLRWGVSS